MIKYKQFKDKYSNQVYNLIHDIMIEELNMDEETIQNTTKDLKDIKNEYFNKEGKFWIAVDEEIDEVVGTVAIKRIDKDSAEFKRYYVKKEYRNKNIGYKLYRIAERYVKISDIKTLFLASGRNLAKAHSIYYKNDWKLIDKNSVKVNIYIRDEAKLFRKDFNK